MASDFLKFKPKLETLPSKKEKTKSKRVAVNEDIKSKVRKSMYFSAILKAEATVDHKKTEIKA